MAGRYLSLKAIYLCLKIIQDTGGEKWAEECLGERSSETSLNGSFYPLVLTIQGEVWSTHGHEWGQRQPLAVLCNINPGAPASGLEVANVVSFLQTRSSPAPSWGNHLLTLPIFFHLLVSWHFASSLGQWIRKLPLETSVLLAPRLSFPSGTWAPLPTI